jgi:hypothetical protein
VPFPPHHKPLLCAAGEGEARRRGREHVTAR